MRYELSLIVFCVSAACGAAEMKVDDLFEKPVALADASGAVLLTNLAEGCPTAADYNGDGKVDLILGAHESMDTPVGGIWLIPNTGTNEKPAFSMKDAYRVNDQDGVLKAGCGCKSAGQVLVQAADFKGDGWIDIVFSDTYAHAYILLNDRKSKDKPTFTRQPFYDMEKVNHGMMAGGGDWDGDGVRDWLHMPFAGEEYKFLKGDALGGKGLKFEQVANVRQAHPVKISGDKAVTCAWAWDFSGTAKARGVIEYAGIAGGDAREICLYELKDGVSRKVCVLVKAEGSDPRFTLADLNGDGKMDLLYSSGNFGEKAATKIVVLYGKVANIK